MAQSDIVSIHTPSTPETNGMVNEDFLRKMKTDAMLINTSHGNLVNEDALLNKLETCPDFWVGTDFYNGQPAAEAAGGGNGVEIPSEQAHRDDRRAWAASSESFLFA